MTAHAQHYPQGSLPESWDPAFLLGVSRTDAVLKGQTPEMKHVFTINHTGACCVILLAGRVVQELRSQLPEASQGFPERQAEETGLSWECAGFEHPRPAL